MRASLFGVRCVPASHKQQVEHDFLPDRERHTICGALCVRTDVHAQRGCQYDTRFNRGMTNSCKVYLNAAKCKILYPNICSVHLRLL
jgi:hypothetical protein